MASPTAKWGNDKGLIGSGWDNCAEMVATPEPESIIDKSLMHSSRFFEGEVGGFPSSGRVTGYSVERLGYLRESLSISLAEILQ
jgi:hypothetical protein